MVAPPFISAAQGLCATVWDRRSSSIASFWFWTAGTAHRDQLVRVHIGAETHRYPVKLGAQFRLVWPRSPLMHLSGRSSGQVRDGQRQPEMARGSERGGGLVYPAIHGSSLCACACCAHSSPDRRAVEMTTLVSPPCRHNRANCGNWRWIRLRMTMSSCEQGLAIVNVVPDKSDQVHTSIEPRNPRVANRFLRDDRREDRRDDGDDTRENWEGGAELDEAWPLCNIDMQFCIRTGQSTVAYPSAVASTSSTTPRRCGRDHHPRRRVGRHRHGWPAPGPPWHKRRRAPGLTGSGYGLPTAWNLGKLGGIAKVPLMPCMFPLIHPPVASLLQLASQAMPDAISIPMTPVARHSGGTVQACG